jgi:hypothetical protein
MSSDDEMSACLPYPVVMGRRMDDGGGNLLQVIRSTSTVTHCTAMSGTRYYPVPVVLGPQYQGSHSVTVLKRQESEPENNRGEARV